MRALSSPPEDIDRATSWPHVVRRLMAEARCRGASVEEAEDLVQDVLMVTIRDPSWHRPERASLLTALSAVLRNRLTDRRRHLAVRKRTAPHLVLLHDRAADDPATHLARARARDRRAAILERLTPEELVLFRMWLRQRQREVDAQQAAAALNLTPAAYEAAKKRLRRRVRTVLAELRLTTQDLFHDRSGELA